MAVACAGAAPKPFGTRSTASDGDGVRHLDDDDLRTFARDGYLMVPGLIADDVLAAADREVEDLVRQVPPMDGDAATPGQHGWFPPVAALPRCDDLLRRSPALAIAEELVAPNTLEHRFDHIQLATTVPPWPHVPGAPHIDGHGPGQDPPFSFTLLAGILLTDQHATQTGNIWVWPGSHLRHQELFTERGTKVLQQTGGHSMALDPPLALGPPVEVRGGRGDLFLAHFLLGHNKGGNTSSQTRRTVYYRLSVPGHLQRWHDTFLDAWTEFPRVRDQPRIGPLCGRRARHVTPCVSS